MGGSKTIVLSLDSSDHLKQGLSGIYFFSADFTRVFCFPYYLQEATSISDVGPFLCTQSK